MKKLITLTLCIAFCFGATACGKKGDVAPPAGYDAPSGD